MIKREKKNNVSSDKRREKTMWVQTMKTFEFRYYKLIECGEKVWIKIWIGENVESQKE